MSNFQWDGEDKDSVILPHQPRTAVYTGCHGHVVVRQERDFDEDQDPQLVFTPQGAIAIAWAMIEEARNIGLPKQPASMPPSAVGDQPPAPESTTDPTGRSTGPRADRGAPLLQAVGGTE